MQLLVFRLVAAAGFVLLASSVLAAIEGEEEEAILADDEYDDNVDNGDELTLQFAFLLDNIVEFIFKTKEK